MDGETVVRRASNDDEPFSALAFKIATDPFVGTLTFFRVYSGTLTTGTAVFNSVKGKKERVGRMVQMHSNSREELKKSSQVILLRRSASKMLQPVTRFAQSTKPVVLERMEFPEPVISVAVEPGHRQTKRKLGVALGKLAQEDPSFRVKTDEETGQTIISGMGELAFRYYCRSYASENSVLRPILESRRWHTESELKISLRLKGSLFVSREAGAVRTCSIKI